MPCTCHDPVAFGHHHDATDLPYQTFHASRITTQLIETSQAMQTLTQTSTMALEALEAVRDLPYPPETPWNWLEPGQTHPLLAELWGTSEPCA